MNDKIKNMVDTAASDGILSLDELRLIKKVSAKENVNWDEVEFYMLQVGALNEKLNEYDISNDNLISIISTWLTRLNQGKFEGVAEPFPSKIIDSNFKKAAAAGFKLFTTANNTIKEQETKLSRFDKFKMKATKTVINSSINMVPGGLLVKNIGLNLISQIIPQAKKISKEDIKIELDKYIEILALRVKTKKINETILFGINEKITNIG